MAVQDASGECWMSDIPGATPCAGPVDTYRSRTGATEAERCERHQEEHERRMDALEARLQRDYPGWDVPGSPPPPWFDQDAAGERWDDE